MPGRDPGVPQFPLGFSADSGDMAKGVHQHGKGLISAEFLLAEYEDTSVSATLHSEAGIRLLERVLAQNRKKSNEKGDIQLFHSKKLMSLPGGRYRT